MEESFTDTSKSPRFSEKKTSRFLLALPTALFVVGCGAMMFEMTMNSARGQGVSKLILHLIAGTIFMVILAIPFAYQMHVAGNGKGLLAGVLLCLLTGLINLATVISYWPLKLSLAREEATLIGISETLKPGEKRTMDTSVGMIIFRDAWKLPSGQTCFTNGYEGDATGLIYDPEGNPTGINEWSNVRVADKWSVVEQD